MSQCLVALLLCIVAAVPAQASLPRVTGQERLVGAPCEGCEAVFQGLPDRFDSVARLAPDAEPGERLRLTGTVTDADGQPRPGVVLYAYQTNAGGRYPRDSSLSGSAARHGRLRAWVVTDGKGRYTFESIRPGSYPLVAEPQHIHMHAIEPGRCTYYLGDVLFADDPNLDDARRARQQQARGGDGIVVPRGSAHDGWAATRDIRLGLNVPGYAACGDSLGGSSTNRPWPGQGR